MVDHLQEGTFYGSDVTLKVLRLKIHALTLNVSSIIRRQIKSLTSYVYRQPKSNQQESNTFKFYGGS